MSKDFDSVLVEGEQIKWEGKPKFLPYIFSSGATILIGIIFLAMTSWISSFTKSFSSVKNSLPVRNIAMQQRAVPAVDKATELIDKQTSAFSVILIPFYVIGFALILSPVFKIFAYEKEKYAFTDKRIIISRGVIAQNFKTIDYKNIKNSQVKIGLIDKLFSVGKILIFTGEIASTGGQNSSVYSLSDNLVGLSDPYEVYKILMSLSEEKK
ncbi:PH domain-containing protein [Candidatus Dojkabacteria bacterium]|jgi:membrane protein YdbS with pleckstrin-like domain|nr:PH domain-containing protein [Candidatus Dojkabacteria bacterium]